MNIKLQLPKLQNLRPRITVVGVGGAGSNAVNNMIASGLSGVNFVVANTDAQSLANSTAEHRIQLGVTLTEGLGAGARPEIGKASAEEAIEDIRAQIAGSHMVFVAAGMGGGTGTGAAAVIARIARECGALTVGVVTKPFQFEGTRRMRAAEIGIAAIKPEVDTLIVIPNQNLFRIATERTTFADAFVLADKVLYSGIACVVDLIVKDGLINLDFADVRTVMSNMGTAMMGTGEATGDRRAAFAAEAAISNPLLDDISLRGARGLLVSITGNRDMTLYEVDEAANRVRQEVDPEATIIVGATFDDTIGDAVRVSIVASGMERQAPQQEWEQPVQLAASPAPAVTHPVAHQAVVESSPHQQLSSLSAAQAQPADNGYGQQAPLHQQAPAHPQQQPAQVYPAGAPRTAAEQADLTRAISEALSRSPGHSPGNPQGHDAGTFDQHSGGQTWSSQGGAVYTEAPPQLSAPPGWPERDYQHTEPVSAQADTGFAPQPPAEPPRAARRLPQVEDFPPVGQRDYHAKSGQYTEPPSPPPPRAYAAPPPEPPRKLGFFERLTGARRKSATKTPPSAPDPQAASGPISGHWPAGVDAPRGASDPSSADYRASGEPHDLPVFFGGNRK